VLALSRPPRATVWVQPPASSALPTARCPAHTLEDEGVCIPVPKPQSADPEGYIARLPERPDELAQYRLPLQGPAELVAAEAAPVPEQLRRPGQALAIRCASPTPITAEFLGSAVVVGVDHEQGWAILTHATPQLGRALTALVLLGGMKEVPEELQAGPVPATARLGTCNEVLWLTVRGLRTAEPTSLQAWQGDGSVGVDPRNVLGLLEDEVPPPPSTATE